MEVSADIVLATSCMPSIGSAGAIDAGTDLLLDIDAISCVSTCIVSSCNTIVL